jgi:hypothetical protein
MRKYSKFRPRKRHEKYHLPQRRKDAKIFSFIFPGFSLRLRVFAANDHKNPNFLKSFSARRKPDPAQYNGSNPHAKG